MCNGPLKNLCHWGPLTALGIIKIVSFITISCNEQWWPPRESLSGFLHSSLFIFFCASTLYNFLNAMYIGPGYLPIGWHPYDKSNISDLQFCPVCQGYKAPRSHHCKKCGRCVLKMDHHCPWINGCVGHRNHSSFTLFLLFAICGCAQATVVIGSTLYYALHRTWYLYHGTGAEPIVTMSLYMFAISVFALGLAIGVVIAVGMLFICQVRAIGRNRTTIEDWIIAKAEYRQNLAAARGDPLPPFVFPYHVGFWNNICQVLNFSMTPRGDGIWWDLAPGCDQYTLTREQIAQKSQKKQRSRIFIAIRAYSGYILPVVHGIKVLCRPPCSDEPRMPLCEGEHVLVSRYLKHWFFGEKTPVSGVSGVQVTKGWFPRCCVIPLDTERSEALNNSVPHTSTADISNTTDSPHTDTLHNDSPNTESLHGFVDLDVALEMLDKLKKTD